MNSYCSFNILLILTKNNIINHCKSKIYVGINLLAQIKALIKQTLIPHYYGSSVELIAKLFLF